MGWLKHHFNTSHVSINRRPPPDPWISSMISIHLMFLLIVSSRLQSSKECNYFNTSHVSINLNQRYLYTLTTFISIHLMFLLISSIRSFTAFRLHFNTSHVSINHMLKPHWGIVIGISIHLMFLLIGLVVDPSLSIKPFQYISCFY